MNIEGDPAAGLNGAVAAELSDRRVRVGMTIDQLADATGISARTLMRYLSTVERHMPVEVLGRVSEALGAAPDEVLASAVARA